jgi:hypothetical protein
MAADKDKLSHRKPVTAWNSGYVFPLQFSLNSFDRNVEFKLLSSPGTFQKYSSIRDRARLAISKLILKHCIRVLARNVYCSS